MNILRGIMNILSKKSKSKRTTFTGIEITEKKKHKSDHEFTTDVIPFNDAFKECGCLPDCGCKE